MADEQELTVRIKADTGNAVTGTSAVADAFVRLEALMARSGVAGKVMGEDIAHGHTKAREGAEGHERAETILGASIGKVEVATNSAARAFQVLGFHTGEATERVLGMTEAIEGLGKVALPLAAIGAGFIAIGAGFNFLAEGIRGAAAEEKTLNQLASAVRAQGGDWAKTREEVEGFATSLAHATTISRGEALDALRALSSAGVSVGDSEKIIAVASDVAAGSGRSLIEVTNEIKQAEVGRALGLAQLDPRLKEIIKSHGTLHQVLDELSRTYSGQATDATNTFEGKQRVLQNRLEELSVTIGTELLPALTTGADLLIGFASEAEKSSSGFSNFVRSIVDGSRLSARALEDLGKIAVAVAQEVTHPLDWIGQIGDKLGDGITGPNGFVHHADPKNPFNTIPNAVGDLASLSGAGIGGYDPLKAAPGAGVPPAIFSAIDAAAKKLAPESGLTVEKLTAIVTAIAKQETNFGNSANYDARTGRDRDGNQGRGIFQLDPASGASRAELDLVSTNYNAAALKATEMIVDGLKRSHGNPIPAIEGYGPHLKGGAPDPAYVTSVMKIVNDAGLGRTKIPFVDNALTHGDIERQAEKDRLAKLRAELANRPLDNNPNIGNSKTSNKAPFEYTKDDTAIKATDAYKIAEDALDLSLKRTKKSEDELAESVRLAVGPQEKLRTELALASAQSHDAITERDKLRVAIGEETFSRATLTTTLKAETTAAADAKAQQDAYGRALAAIGDPSKEQLQHLRDLERAHKAADAAVNATQKSIDELTGYITKNETAVESLTQRLGAYQLATQNVTAEMHKAIKASQDSMAADVGKDLVAKGQSQDARDAQIRAIVDQESTYKKSLEQQIAYYQQQYGISVAAHGTDTKESQKYYDEIVKLEGEQFKKRVDASDAFNARATSLETNFVDGILSKHKSMRDSLGDIFKQILADYIKMIEEMVVKSAMFSGLNATLAKAFNIGIGGASGNAGGVFGSGASVGAGGPVTGGPVTGGLGAVVSLASESKQALTGSSTGVDPNSPQAAFNSSGGGYATTAGVQFQGSTIDAKGNLISNSAGLATRAVGAAGGLGLAIDGYKQGGIGGGLETGLGITSLISAIAPHFGPWGVAIAGVAGLVSMFSHKDDPAKMPDKYDTTPYGQGVANLTGRSAGANGQTFYADTSMLQQTGGVGAIAFIEKQLAGAKKGADGYFTLPDGSKLNPGQYQEYLSTFGASASGSGQLNFGHDIGKQWITGATGASSNARSYKDIDALAQQFLSLPGSSSALAKAPQFSISRSYPDMNIGTIVASAVAATSATNGGTMSGAGPVKPVVVNVTVGTVAGAGGLEQLGHDLAEYVGVGLQRIHSGQLPGAGSPAGFGGRQRYRGSA